MTTASTAPAAVTTASRARDRAASVARLMPRALSTGYSAESRLSCRLSSWPMTASAIRASSAANTPRATACGWIARWVAASSSRRLTTITPLVAG